MKRFITTFWILAPVLLLVATAAFAQGGTTSDRIADELDRTDEVITRAREAAMATQSAQAKLAFEHAVKLQTQARAEFRQGPGGGRWELAMRLTLQARVKAQEAISAASGSGWGSQPNETALVRRLERADELLDQALEAVNQLDNQALVALYQSAQLNLDRAYEFYREQQYRASLKLANQAERTAEKLLHTANREARSDQNYERRRDNVKRFMEQAQEQMQKCIVPTTLQLQQRAREAFELAERLENSGDRAGALRALQNCRELTAQALRECAGEDNLQRRYELLRGQADRLVEELDPSNDGARVLLDQALTQLQLVDQALQQNELQAVIAALKAAQLSLDEAQRRIQNEVR